MNKLCMRIKKMFRFDLERNYVSPIQRFLADFDAKHPQKSNSQEKEIRKHQQIALRRDKVITSAQSEEEKRLWDQF